MFTLYKEDYQIILFWNWIKTVGLLILVAFGASLDIFGVVTIFSETDDGQHHAIIWLMGSSMLVVGALFAGYMIWTISSIWFEWGQEDKPNMLRAESLPFRERRRLAKEAKYRAKYAAQNG